MALTMPRTQSGFIQAISTSRQKGTPKTNVVSAKLIPGHGIDGDAHAGPGHRQISLLAAEDIANVHAQGIDIQPGVFAENIATSGIDLTAVRIGDRLTVGDCLLEITQIGKECHDHCAIFERVGECIMQNQGFFAVVIQGGNINVGDEIVIHPHILTNEHS